MSEETTDAGEDRNAARHQAVEDVYSAFTSLGEAEKMFSDAAGKAAEAIKRAVCLGVSGRRIGELAKGLLGDMAMTSMRTFLRDEAVLRERERRQTIPTSFGRRGGRLTLARFLKWLAEHTETPDEKEAAMARFQASLRRLREDPEYAEYIRRLADEADADAGGNIPR